MPVNCADTQHEFAQKVGSFPWCWGRSPGRVSATLWERSRQIHLQCWHTLLEVSLENQLLIERSTNHFEQKHISLLILPRKYETIAFVSCLTTGSKNFCWNIALRYKTCINLVTQSKTWGRHRSHLTLGGTVSHSSAFGICRPLWLFLVGILQTKGFQNITVKVFLKGVCMQVGEVINACLFHRLALFSWGMKKGAAHQDSCNLPEHKPSHHRFAAIVCGLSSGMCVCLFSVDPKQPRLVKHSHCTNG